MYFPASCIHLPNLGEQSAVGRERSEIPLREDVREIGEKELTELETVFRDEQYTAIRDTVRNQVERYEEAVRRRAEQLERATIKERKAKRLLDDVKRLRGE